MDNTQMKRHNIIKFHIEEFSVPSCYRLCLVSQFSLQKSVLKHSESMWHLAVEMSLGSFSTIHNTAQHHNLENHSKHFKLKFFPYGKS
jgi:hypothetical protein